MARYAQSTEFSSDKSRSEIERTLQRYGATRFLYGWEPKRAVIGFEINSRQIKMFLPLPNYEDFGLTDSKRWARSEESQQRAYDQAIRQRWRALALVIKAKLEAVEAGITTTEDEFLAHTVLPDGSTVGQFMRPQLAAAYERGDMPKMLPAAVS